MEIKHCCVSVLDVPEVFPFGFEQSDNVMEMLEGSDVSEGSLIDFMTDLELEFAEGIYQLGQDMVGEKFYRRYIFEKGGFVEVAMEKPCAIIAHFISLDRGHVFAEALSSTLKKYVAGEIADLLIGDIQVSYQEEAELTNYKVAELRKLRNV